MTVWTINNCGYAFLGEENTFRFGGASDLSNSSDLIQRVESSVHIVIDWVIGHDRNCSQATECKENSECHDADGGGYNCRCNQGYEGNLILIKAAKTSTSVTTEATLVVTGIALIQKEVTIAHVGQDTPWRASAILQMAQYTYNDYRISADYSGYWPHTLSEVNRFTVIGCDDYAWVTSETKSRNVLAGCMVFCANQEEVVGNECIGNGCCQSSISQDINSYTTKLNYLSDSGNMSNRRSYAPCTYAFVGETNLFKFNGATHLINGTSFVERIEATMPLVLEWAIGNLSCPEAEATNGYVCQSNSKCVNSTRESDGYRCVCKEGYEGNPYLPPGCQDVNECENPEEYPCYGVCVNTRGSYDCMCRREFNGNPKIKNGCRRSAGYSKFSTIIFILGAVLGTGILVLSIGVNKLIQKRRKRDVKRYSSREMVVCCYSNKH